MNRSILLVKRPTGMPSLKDFQIVKREIPTIQDGEVLLKTKYLSVDPFMRGKMRDRKSYTPPYQLNEPITCSGIGEVIESKNPNFQVGDLVSAVMSWAEYNKGDNQTVRKLNPDIPITAAQGVLGMTGRTAYFGLLYKGQPKAGETVVISGAAGAVGSVVGQIARLKGCRVVGICGSDEKKQYLIEELGFNAVVNYKTENVREALQQYCPNGIDIYFDNVGGDITDQVISHINFGARIVICGAISEYNFAEASVGPRLFPILLNRSASAHGFIVSDFDSLRQEADNQLQEWLIQGKIKSKETIIEGFENTVPAFISLFEGGNIGKMIVQVH
ncbi:MAG TPA: NADP-dependent oxidoreductase [Pseudoneobacillus sp.]|nr:NADP-dependent oxidoreductase [Pseudoneobacillus sp.]